MRFFKKKIAVYLSLLIAIFSGWYFLKKEVFFKKKPEVLVQSPADSGFVHVQGDKLYLDGEPFYVKGTNYLGGSYLELNSYPQKDGRYLWNAYQKFQNWDAVKIEEEIRLLRQNLDINSIRLFAPPSIDHEDSWVEWHGFEPWFLPEDNNQSLPAGSVNPVLADRLLELIEIAGRNEIKTQLVFFLGVQHEVENGKVLPGSDYERKYFNFLESLLPHLKDDPAILAYEFGNEMLIYEGNLQADNNNFAARQLSFIKRMIDKTHFLDSKHLITTGEIVCRKEDICQNLWWYPLADFQNFADLDDLNNGQPFSLFSLVDFISPHFYMTNQNEIDILVDQVKKRSYKPIIVGEFGWPQNWPENYSDWHQIPQNPKAQANYYSEVFKAVEKHDLAGFINWGHICPTNIDIYQFVKLEGFLTRIEPWCIFKGPDSDPLPAVGVFKNFRESCVVQGANRCKGVVGRQTCQQGYWKDNPCPSEQKCQYGGSCVTPGSQDCTIWNYTNAHNSSPLANGDHRFVCFDTTYYFCGPDSGNQWQAQGIVTYNSANPTIGDWDCDGSKWLNSFCRYDYTGDGRIDISDALYVLAHWATVGISGFLGVLSGWGASCG